MITGLTVISAVCRKLHAAFPKVKIYREHIGENFAEPSFFVWTESVEISPFEPRKDLMWHRVEIQYFPHHDSTSMYEDMLNIGMKLPEVLQSIDVEIDEKTSPIWAISPNYRIVNDNMLSYSLNFRVETYIADKKQELMAEMDSRIQIAHTQ